MGIMCFGNSKQDDPEARKNAEIEKQLKADQKRQLREVKMLLLGMHGRPSMLGWRPAVCSAFANHPNYLQALERVASQQC